MQTSFGNVSNLVSEQLQRAGIDVDPVKAVLAMTSRVGQLAQFCGDKFSSAAAAAQQQQQSQSNISRGPSPNATNPNQQQQMTPTEQRELYNILGDLTVALFAVASSTNVDLGEASLRSLGMPAQVSASMMMNQQQQQNQQQSQQAGGMLNNIVLQQPPTTLPSRISQQQQMQQQNKESSGSPNYSLPPVAQTTSVSQPAVMGINTTATSASSSQQSAQQQQQQMQQPSGTTNNSSAANSQSPWRNNIPQVAARDTSLNPRIMSNVRDYIQHIRMQNFAVTDEEFTDINLTWCYENPFNPNEVIELCEHGHNIPVRRSNFEEFAAAFMNSSARVEMLAAQQQQQQQQNYSPAPLNQQNVEQEQEEGGNDNGEGFSLTSPTLRPSQAPSEQQQQDQQQDQQQQQKKKSGSEGEIVSREAGAITRRIKVDVTGHPDLAREQAGYSPSHANFGLFSPQAKGDEIDVTYPEDLKSPGQGQVQIPPRPNQQQQQQQQPEENVVQAQQQLFQQQHEQEGGAEITGSPSVPLTQQLSAPSQQQQQQGDESPNKQQQASASSSPSQQQQQQQQANVPPQTGSSGYSTPSTIVGGSQVFPQADPADVASKEALFSPRFTHLERLIVDVEDQLNAHGKSTNAIRQLLPMYLPKEEVVSLNLSFSIPFKEKAFDLIEGSGMIPVTVHNAKDFVTHVREQQAVFEGRLNKKASVKTYAISQPHGGDTGRDLGGFETHGRAGNLTAPPETKSTFTIDTDDSSNLVPKALRKEKVPPLLPSASHYVAFISSHPEQFPEMFRSMMSRPEMLGRWNVAWIVPDPDADPPTSLQHATEHNPRRCGVRELIPNGMSITVRESELDTFKQKVASVSTSLPSCLRPAS